MLVERRLYMYVVSGYMKSVGCESTTALTQWVHMAHQAHMYTLMHTGTNVL
jgi:hypothetical protein